MLHGGGGACTHIQHQQVARWSSRPTLIDDMGSSPTDMMLASSLGSGFIPMPHIWFVVSSRC